MKAFQLIEHGDPGKFEIRDIPRPKPDADEVLIAVRACGLNHLDLWLERGKLPIPVELPRTPGGEIAGVVEEIGPDVKDWKPGDRVAVQSNQFCGECEFCRDGQESQCLSSQLTGVHNDGGFAEFVLIPQRNLIALPDGLSFRDSAALTLAGSTAMHMLTDRTSIKPGDIVLAMAGASGVGSAAIQIARELGAHVIATASSEKKRKLSLELGAEHAIDSSDENWWKEVRRVTNKRGADIIVEHIGGSVLEAAFNCLARNGTIVTCGATAGQDIHLNLWPMFVKQQRLVGSYGRTCKDLRATLEWAAKGRVKPVIHDVLALEDAENGFDLLRKRRVLGKILVEP